MPTELSTFLDRLGATLVRRPFYHSLGWLGFLAILVVLQLQTGEYGLVMTLASEIITILIYATVVYINLLYLFPNYLRSGQYWLYLGLLILTTIIFTPMEMVLKYFLFTGYPELQAGVLFNQSAYFLSTFLVLGVSTVGKIMTDWIVQNRNKQRAENESMQSELRFLKSQINPHFLFNTLNSLYALTLKKSDKAPEVVIKLSEMMRYMLYECNEPLVPLRKEINYLQNYLELERLRQRDNIEIEFTVGGTVADQQVAPLLLIPFLENAFKHGVGSAIDRGFVHASLDVTPAELTFQMENSKGSVMPRSPHGNRPSGGIGLINVRRRLELLYPDRYDIDIRDTPTTYCVSLRLELQRSLVRLPPAHPLTNHANPGTRAFHP